MDTQQHEIYEYARKRVTQKKRLYFHFVVFLVGSLFFYAANKRLNAWPETDWALWMSTAWLFILILHFIKVFVTDRFMNQKWERTQIDRLMALQEKKISELKNEWQNKP